MKNKNITYLLLTVVLVVWGLVFYKIFAGLGDGYEPSFTITNRKPVKQVFEQVDEILVLNVNYRDPFLGTTSKATIFQDNTTRNTKIHNAGTHKQKKEKITDWSFIDYVGIVNNKETNKKIALVVVSGKEYMVNEQEVIDGITFLKRERDSLLVQFEGEKEWVRR